MAKAAEAVENIELSGGPDAAEIVVAVSGLALIAFGISAGIAFALARSRPVSARGKVQLLSASVLPIAALVFLVFGRMAIDDVSFSKALSDVGEMDLRGWLVIGVLFLSGWLGARVVYRLLVRQGRFSGYDAGVFD